MRNIALILVLLSAVPARAETPMTAEAFEAYVQGRTLTFGNGQGPYGIETYHDGRRVTWAFLGGDCEPGKWYEDNGSICFVYDFEPTPQCWQFFEEADGLRAVFTNDPASTILYEVLEADQSMICPGFGV